MPHVPSSNVVRGCKNVDRNYDVDVIWIRIHCRLQSSLFQIWFQVAKLLTRLRQSVKKGMPFSDLWLDKLQDPMEFCNFNFHIHSGDFSCVCAHSCWQSCNSMNIQEYSFRVWWNINPEELVRIKIWTSWIAYAAFSSTNLDLQNWVC